jgi:hypothetical protein
MRLILLPIVACFEQTSQVSIVGISVKGEVGAVAEGLRELGRQAVTKAR